MVRMNITNNEIHAMKYELDFGWYRFESNSVSYSREKSSHKLKAVHNKKGK